MRGSQFIFIVRSSESSSAADGKKTIGLLLTKASVTLSEDKATSGEAVFLCLNVKVWIPCRLGVKNTKVLPIQHEIREFLTQNFL